MRRLISSLIFIGLAYNLAFPEDINLNKHFVSNNSVLYRNVLIEKELNLRNGREIKELNNEEKDTISNKKAGTFLIFTGGLIAAFGVSMIGISLSGLDYMDEEKFRVPGIVVTSVGLGMMLWGYVLSKSNSKKSSYIVLNLNPFNTTVALSYRINF